VVVNGSPLWPPVTGVQRVARGLTARIVAEAAPREVRVAGGPEGFGGTRDRFPGGRAARLAWEQTVLPILARGSHVVNLGNLAPLASRSTLVLTYDLHVLHAPEHYRRGVASAYWRLAEAAYRRAAVRITLSRTVAEDLEATLGGRVDEVVPPGIDDDFRPVGGARRDAIRRRFDLRGRYLVVVGWAQPSKRADLAIEAHRAAAARVAHDLVMVGGASGNYPGSRPDGLPATVRWVGRLSDADLAAVYSGSSGLLFPSEYEGFGLPPVEALACGAPVASSELPVLREVVGGLPGVRFVAGWDREAWTEAAERLLADDDGDDASAERSSAARARYPWEGKGRTILDLLP
jgi:glycosyltransferase involved in cell wall biosynthesis